MVLNKSDLKQIGDIVDNKLDVRLENQKEDILEAVDEKITNLKSDLFEKIDPILKEVVTAREERPLIENRLEKLEKIHRKGKHALASN